MNRLMNCVRWLIAPLALIWVTGAAAQAADKPIKLRWGAPTADYFGLYVAKDLGLFEKQGIEPEFYWFQSGAPLLAGLKSESLDVITTGLATVFALGQKIPLKLIYWDLDHAAGEGLVVSEKSAIRSYEEIAQAKTIGATSGTCAQVALALMANKVGVKYSSLNVVNIAPPLFANAMMSNSIDAGIAWSPYSAALAEKGHRVVSWDAEYTPEGGICPGLTGVRPKVLQKHPDLGVKLVRVRAQAMEAIAKNPQLAIDALVKYLSISKETAKAAYERECCNRMPTIEQQLDPKSQYSLTAKRGGLAKKLLIASETLQQTGTIPTALTWDQINDAIDPIYLQQFVTGGKK
jgi:NitT/TauT family transport system substrate-binding protein